MLLLLSWGHHSLNSRSKTLSNLMLNSFIYISKISLMLSSRRAYVSNDLTRFTSWWLKWDMAALQRLSSVCSNGFKPLSVACLTKARGDAANVCTRWTRSFLFWDNSCCIYTFCSSSSAPQGENPIYKSAVTTVVNPKYEGKWWSLTLTTLYGTVCGINGGGFFLMLSLFVVATIL